MEAAAKTCINCFQALEDNNICPVCGFDEIKHKTIFYHLKPRTVLHSKYLIGKALAEDAFGIAYAASEIDSGQKFTIKELFPAGIAKRVHYVTTAIRVDKANAELFNRIEKKFNDIAQKLVLFSEQSKVTRYRDFFLENNSAYLVEEIIEGITLAEYLQKNGDSKPGFAQTIKLLQPLIQALGNIHKQDIVHNAINPGNIFLNDKEEIILTNFDFTGAKVTSPDQKTSPDKKSYLAPERYKEDGKEGPWTDIYSLAAVIYKAVTANELPATDELPAVDELSAVGERSAANELPATDEMSATDKLPATGERQKVAPETKWPFVNLKEAGVEITPKDEETLLKALSLEIQDRYQTVEEFAENLEIFQELVTAEEELNLNEQPSSEDASLPEPPAPPVRKEEPPETPPSPEPPPESMMYSEEQSICGNTPGNIANGGMVAAADKYVYYKNPADFGKLYRTTTNSLESYKISDDDISFLNVIGGWIYYSNASDKGRIYKLWAENGYKSKLGNDAAEFINISDGWIYYRNKSDLGKLYKIKTNGTDRTKLADNDAAYINVSGEWVYYSNKSDKGNLYKIKTDGSEQQKLSDDESEYLSIADGWIYYINRSENNRLYKIDTDGAGKTKLSNDNIFHVNVNGEWAYYRNESDGGKLYKARIRGLFLLPVFVWLNKIFPRIFQNRVKIINDVAKSINVVDDWLYYFKMQDSHIYKIKFDGSNHRAV